MAQLAFPRPRPQSIGLKIRTSSLCLELCVAGGGRACGLRDLCPLHRRRNTLTRQIQLLALRHVNLVRPCSASVLFPHRQNFF